MLHGAIKARSQYHRRFQSDHDYELIEELNNEANLPQLEMAIKGLDYTPPPPQLEGMGIHLANSGKALFVGQNASVYVSDLLRKGLGRTNYSMYRPFCSDVATVRKHLDAGGVLDKMLADKERKMMLDERSSDPGKVSAGPAYEFVFLCACAMSLGCKLSTYTRDVLKKVYMCSGLLEGAVLQMKKALFGPKGFVEGRPYNFGSLDLNAAMDKANITQQPGPNGTIGMNVPEGPGGMFYKPPKGSTAGMTELKTKFWKKRFPSGACSGCGATEGKNGGELLSCGGCRKHRYCSKECQREHWKLAHKKFCKEEAEEKEEDVKPVTQATKSVSETEVVEDLMKATIEDID